MLQRVIAAQFQRLEVRLQQRFLALVLLGEQLFDFCRVDVEQGRQRADINDVLEQLSLARIRVRFIADFRQRYADNVDIVAELRFRQQLGAVVKQIATGIDFLNVLVPRLRIHRHHHVHTATSTLIAGFVHAHFVPRGQALNIRRKNIAR